MMQEMDAKDEVKKEGLMALIKKMYELMAEGKSGDEEAMEEGMEMPEIMEKKDEGESLMAKAMGESEKPDMGDELDMDEVKEYLTKRKKAPVGKAINIMAITKTPMQKFNSPKMKKY